MKFSATQLKETGHAVWAALGVWPRPVILAVATGFVLAGALLGAWLGRVPVPSKPSDEMAGNPAVRDFVRTLETIEEHYAVPPDKERLTHGAVQGMLRALDPHSNFYDPREFSEMQDEQSSRFYGIGVTVNRRNGRIYVLGVSPGMPAERAGLRYGDAIVAVDEKQAQGWEQSDALRHVRGKRGTEVRVTVERAGHPEPMTFNITRDEVPYPSVRSAFMLRPDVGYIGLTGGFNHETSEELHDAIERLKPQGMAALVLDLRNNPGGLLKQAVRVAETFLPKGLEIVSVRYREGRDPEQVYRSENTRPETMPMVLLIDGDTASASEVVASALQDRQRALLVGEKSFGKGLVQTVYRLRWGTGLTLTTGKYFTPNGRSIQRPYDDVGAYDYFYSPSSGAAGGGSIAKPQAHSRNGGIRPDVEVRLSEPDVRLRDACFEFARLLVAGQIPALPEYVVRQTQYEYRLRGVEYPVSEPLLAAFRAFLRERPALQIGEARLNRGLEYIRRRIRAEIITAAYGVETAEQFLLEGDEQAARALDEIPKARQLRDQARLFPPASTVPDRQ
jgi:carboxyl-terminal processing protease